MDTSALLLPIAKTPQYFERIQQKLPLIDGAADNLQYLARIYSMALLTQGNTQVQKTKVESLGIKDFFKELFFADLEKSETKKLYFSRLVAQEKLATGEFLSIGNRLSTDIREAKQCGGKTCLFVYGENVSEKPSLPEDLPDFKINHHKELLTVCKL